MSRSARAALLVAMLLTSLAAAQDERFAFMPEGGIQLLQGVLDTCGDCGTLAELSAGERSAEQWRTYLDERDALGELDEQQLQTLTRYLASAFPAEAPIEEASALPPDGRTIVIFQCQVCHSIAIPMLEDRDVGYWLGHRTRPPHDAFDLTDAEWARIADYLALNAPIPEETIPEELRQGAGGY